MMSGLSVLPDGFLASTQTGGVNAVFPIHPHTIIPAALTREPVFAASGKPPTPETAGRGFPTVLAACAPWQLPDPIRTISMPQRSGAFTGPPTAAAAGGRGFCSVAPDALSTLRPNILIVARSS